jgi:hypothetical protein
MEDDRAPRCRRGRVRGSFAAHKLAHPIHEGRAPQAGSEKARAPRPAGTKAAALAILATVLVAPRLAWGFERQWHLGIDAGYAQLFGEGASAGFGGGAHLAYGLSDMFNALLEVDASRHPGSGSMVWSGAAGLAYTFDVARAVPYAGFVAGPYFTRGDIHNSALTLQFVAGLDYQLERNWAIGIQLRAPVASVSPNVRTIFAVRTSDTTGYAMTLVRIEYLWGF